MIRSFALATAVTMAIAQPQPPSTGDRQRAELHYRAGWQALQAESFDESAKEFSAALEIYPRYTLAYYGLGRAEMGRKRFPEAIHAYEECRRQYRRAAGQKFSAQGDAQRMRQDQQMELREAIRQTSSGPQSQRSQETVRQFQNQLRLIEQNADRGINVSLDTQVPAFLSLALGSAYFRADRLADAEREYRAAVISDPKAGEAHNNLAVVYLMTDWPADAEAAVKAAEKAGYHVNPNLKDDIKKKKGERS